MALALVVGAWHWGQGRTLAPPSSAPAPPYDKVRVLLTKQQQREAADVGGFVENPRSLLRVKSSMRYGEFVWNDDHVPPGPVTIRVDLRTQMLSAFRAGQEIGTAVILFGADAKPTPIGNFPILWKGRDHQSSLYDAPMPFTLRLTGDGVAIHGSDVRWGAATHGCIGVPTDFARHLYAVTKVGDTVAVLRSAGRPGST